MDMEVDMPFEAVQSILKEQQLWETNREYLHKSYITSVLTCPPCIVCNTFSNRNIEKKAKKAHHKHETSYMETIRGMGSAVGSTWVVVRENCQ